MVLVHRHGAVSPLPKVTGPRAAWCDGKASDESGGAGYIDRQAIRFEASGFRRLRG